MEKKRDENEHYRLQSRTLRKKLRPAFLNTDDLEMETRKMLAELIRSGGAMPRKGRKGRGRGKQEGPSDEQPDDPLGTGLTLEQVRNIASSKLHRF